jgi:uncharacterized membrane protein
MGTLAEYYERHKQEIPTTQAFVEKMSVFLGSPGYVAGTLVFVFCWIGWNLVAPDLGYAQIDESPFFWLQGIITLNAFVISTTVLIRQNRMSTLANHHAHLDLQVDLLAEEKTSKIIQMLEELRRDIPNVKDRRDSEAEELSEPTDARAVLSMIKRKQD